MGRLSMNKPATSITEKRRFTRIPFVNHIALVHNDETHSGEVVDISFNGILLNFKHTLNCEDGTLFDSYIHFEDGTKIHADIQLAHQHEQYYGFCFHRIDSHSLVNLFNIISHHFGNKTDCERELISLFREDNGAK